MVEGLLNRTDLDKMASDCQGRLRNGPPHLLRIELANCSVRQGWRVEEGERGRSKQDGQEGSPQRSGKTGARDGGAHWESPLRSTLGEAAPREEKRLKRGMSIGSVSRDSKRSRSR